MSHTRTNGARLNTQAEIDGKVARAQEILGYRFQDPHILEVAITHPSAVESEGVQGSYVRMEFLGDSYLGAFIAEEIYRRFPYLDEGGLTRMKVSLVSGETLSAVAQELGFEQIIIFGGSEKGTGKRGLHSALENVFESCVAALVLDAGPDVAREWVLEVLGPRMDVQRAKEPENPKSSLQEICQVDRVTPTYRLVSTDGPPHDRVFTSQALLDGKVIGEGSGRSKKEAENAAASDALSQMGH